MPFDDAEPKVETREEVVIVDKIRDLLATPKTWCQGRFVRERADGSQSFCMLGAFNLAMGRHVDDDEWDEAEMAVMRAAFGLGPIGIENFNDSTCTTHDDVLELLDMARANLTGENGDAV